VNARRRQGGLGLVEVLVALVVVSFGVLGMAGLQLIGMKHGSGGFNRTKALMLAENMATRMRINPPDATSPAFAWESHRSAVLGAGYCATKPAPYCQASEGREAQSCGTGQLAAFDVWSVTCGDWGIDGASGGVRDELPDGTLTVECDATPCVTGSTYTITVEWNESSARSAAPGAVPDPDALDLKRVQMRLRP